MAITIYCVSYPQLLYHDGSGSGWPIAPSSPCIAIIFTSKGSQVFLAHFNNSQLYRRLFIVYCVKAVNIGCQLIGLGKGRFDLPKLERSGVDSDD